MTQRLATARSDDDLLASLLSRIDLSATDDPLQAVARGRFYVAARLASGRVGLCYREPQPGAEFSPWPLERFIGSLPRAVFHETEPSTKALAIAILNALAPPCPNEQTGDVLDHLPLRATDTVTMIGHFAPLVPRLKALVKTVHIVERNNPTPQCLPESKAEDALSASTVALITASTLVNGSLGTLLSALHNVRLAVLLGASTPLWPSLFHDTPLTHLGGTRVTDPDAVLRYVSEDRGMNDLKPYLRKVAVALGRPNE